MKINTNEKMVNETCVSSHVSAMEIHEGKHRATKVYNFARYGNNYVEPGQAISEILWNAFGPGKATNVWVEYHNGYLRICNDGMPADLNDVFQYGVSTRGSALSSFGTGTTHTAAFFNPSNDRFGMNIKINGIYRGIRAPFGETMLVGEISDSEIDIMKTISNKVVTEFFVYDENSVLADFDFEKRLGEICALQIKNNKKVYFNGNVVAPRIHDCGSLGRRSPRWEHEELVNTECGNFVLQYSNIDCSEDTQKGQDTQGVWLYFNNMLLEHRGVRMFKNISGGAHGKKNDSLQPHNCFNSLRTIVNIVTEDVENAFEMPFNNTKTGIQWNAKSARALRDAVDSRIGYHYRETKAINSEAGKRKCIDYICKQMFWTCEDVVTYATEVRLGNSDLRCDAMIYSGEPFSVENVRNGKTIIRGIVEFKKATVNSNNVNQVFGYLLNAIPSDMIESGAIAMPRAVFVGRDTCKYFNDTIAQFNNHLKFPIEYRFLRYENCEKLTEI